VGYNRFEGGVGEEMTRGCVLTTFLWGRLHREREKRKTEREREREITLHHLRPYNTERRNFFFREKFLNFIMP
jgi:hypothetical protein